MGIAIGLKGAALPLVATALAIEVCTVESWSDDMAMIPKLVSGMDDHWFMAKHG
jgi:hypothetical protein